MRPEIPRYALYVYAHPGQTLGVNVTPASDGPWMLASDVLADRERMDGWRTLALELRHCIEEASYRDDVERRIAALSPDTDTEEETNA